MNHSTPETVEDRMSYARAAALQKAPYFASVIHGFIYVALEGIGTMLCTPRMVLGYDPAWVMEATTAELAADIAHEVNHFYRRHFERVGAVEDPGLFNKAGDLAINPDLRNAGWEIAGKGSARPSIFPADFELPEGLSTEEYYAALLQQKHSKPKPQTKPTKDGSDGDPGAQPDQASEGQDGDGQGSGAPAPGIGSGHCGGIAGGQDDPRLTSLEQAHEGRSDVEMTVIIKQLAVDVKAYAAAGRGRLPAGLEVFVDSMLEEPHVRWQDELAHLLRHTTGRIQSGGEDFSLSRPSKRSVLRRVIRPGMIEQQPEIAIVRDSSGSMSHKELNACIREAYHIVLALGVDEVWFADADADVAMPWTRASAQFFRELRSVHGRGGTNFGPAIAAAQRLQPAPDLLVYCTDGDGYAPDEAPAGMTVVWALLTNKLSQKGPAPWGHTVIISEDPRRRKKEV